MRGVSLIELVVAMVILGILVTFSIQSMTRPVERTQGPEADADFLAIHSSERLYFQKNGQYFVTLGPSMTEAEKTELGMMLNQTNWGFQVTSNNLLGEYLITATRLGSSSFAGKKITVDDQGNRNQGLEDSENWEMAVN
jgi:prepilin-type N-terminal cleavage/methylation domain-containing protein